MGLKQTYFFRNLASYSFLIVLGLLVAFPLLLIISQSLMSNKEVFQWPPLVIPPNPTFDAYIEVFTRPDLKLLSWLGNSLYAASMYTLVVIVVCAPAAYAFSRLRFPGNNVLF